MLELDNILGRAVNHRAFGRGTVTSANGETVTVRFGGEEKRFVYPDAFMQYLAFSDCALQARAQSVYRKTERLRKERLLKAQAEQARRSRLENFEVLGNSQAAFNITDAEEVFGSWTVNAGNYLSGSSRGKTRVPEKLRPNSACLLTFKDPSETEEERSIIGAFMVRPDFFGSECADGVIRAHEDMRIRLDDDARLPFWQYFPGKAKPRWGAVNYKYFSNTAMQRILQDMAENAEGQDRHDILAFRHYHRKLNALY